MYFFQFEGDERLCICALTTKLKKQNSTRHFAVADSFFCFDDDRKVEMQKGILHNKESAAVRAIIALIRPIMIVNNKAAEFYFTKIIS